MMMPAYLRFIGAPLSLSLSLSLSLTLSRARVYATAEPTSRLHMYVYTYMRVYQDSDGGYGWMDVGLEDGYHITA